jgi:hypothetical protein
VTDQKFDRLCEANSFGAVSRNEFTLVPRSMLKALVDAAVSTEILKQQERIKRLEDALTEIESAMKQPASNHRFMQIAGPARQVINIIKKAKEAKL